MTKWLSKQSIELQAATLIKTSLSGIFQPVAYLPDSNKETKRSKIAAAHELSIDRVALEMVQEGRNVACRVDLPLYIRKPPRGSFGSWPSKTNVSPYHLRCVRRGMTYFLFGLQALNDGGELREDLVGLLVVLDLGRDQLRQVAQRLGRVENL